MSNIILCMYSGGLDSAGLLHVLLTRDEFKDYAIHVHHLQLVNPENRALVMHAVTQGALEHMRKSGYREFSYSESLHRYPAFNRQLIWDADLCAFMAGNICNATSDIRYVALGVTKTDIEQGGSDFQGRMGRAQTIFRAVKSLNLNPSEQILPLAQLTKRDIWELLPPELRAHTWSCRRPTYEGKQAIACGKCISCRTLGIAPPPQKEGALPEPSGQQDASGSEGPFTASSPSVPTP
ncbi:MAG: 7-cyano-7-deazaguanine synthase [Proteobacteria bacterium]|nr:7-cyano-7-deazaguanine synthase [Pseudomonadota bacterium]